MNDEQNKETQYRPLATVGDLIDELTRLPRDLPLRIRSKLGLQVLAAAQVVKLLGNTTNGYAPAGDAVLLTPQTFGFEKDGYVVHLDP